MRQRSALRRQCSAAKEKLLARARSWRASRSRCWAAGASLIGGTLSTEILREEALELALEGFLPFCELDDKPQEDKKSLFRELGLPYVSRPGRDAAPGGVSGSRRRSRRRTRFCSTAGSSFRECCAQRVADVVESWYGKRPLVFENNAIWIWRWRWARPTIRYVRVDRRGRAGAGRTAAGLLHGRGSADGEKVRDGVPGAARHGRRLDAGAGSGGPATGGEQAGELPAVLFADADGRQAGGGGGVRAADDGRGTAPARAAERGDPLWQEGGGAAGAGEAGRASDAKWARWRSGRNRRSASTAGGCSSSCGSRCWPSRRSARSRRR